MICRLFKITLSFLFIMIVAGCGWHFKNSELLPPQFHSLVLDNYDEYNEITHVLRTQLELNGVTIIPAQAGKVTLRVNSIESYSKVASVFIHAREAEKILTLKLIATVDIPNKGIYPIETVVHRTFFDDSRAALAKSAEQEMILKQMYEEVVNQLIVKMIALGKISSE